MLVGMAQMTESTLVVTVSPAGRAGRAEWRSHLVEVGFAVVGAAKVAAAASTA